MKTIYIVVSVLLIYIFVIISCLKCPSIKTGGSDIEVLYWVSLIQQGGGNSKSLHYCEKTDSNSKVDCSEPKIEKDRITNLNSNIHLKNNKLVSFEYSDYGGNHDSGYVSSHQRFTIFFVLDHNKIDLNSGAYVITHSIPELVNKKLSTFSQHLICFSLTKDEISDYHTLLSYAFPKYQKVSPTSTKLPLDGWEHEFNPNTMPVCSDKVFSNLKGDSFYEFYQQITDSQLKSDLKDCYSYLQFSNFEIYSFRSRQHTHLFKYGSSKQTGFYHAKDTEKAEIISKNQLSPKPLHHIGLDNFFIVSILKKLPLSVINHRGRENIGSMYINKEKYIVNYIWGSEEKQIHEKVAWEKESGLICFGDSNRQKSQLSHLGTVICFEDKIIVENLITKRKPTLLTSNFQCSDNNKKLPSSCDSQINSLKYESKSFAEQSSQRTFLFLDGPLPTTKLLKGADSLQDENSFRENKDFLKEQLISQYYYHKFTVANNRGPYSMRGNIASRFKKYTQDWQINRLNNFLANLGRDDKFKSVQYEDENQMAAYFETSGGHEFGGTYKKFPVYFGLISNEVTLFKNEEEIRRSLSLQNQYSVEDKYETIEILPIPETEKEPDDIDPNETPSSKLSSQSPERYRSPYRSNPLGLKTVNDNIGNSNLMSRFTATN